MLSNQRHADGFLLYSSMKYTELPVYNQKEKIINAVSNNQVIIVESPTGSGKTTQLPVILHEAGFSGNKMIGVTQPRRIATLSVCEYIAEQLDSSIPGIAGYKMRFEDKTDASTRIKIMTDGILLQELKLDYDLSDYNVIIVDEAHERSLNIDFIFGFLKNILKKRKDFKVVISSATINPAMFSRYFNDAPVISIDSKTYDVDTVYKDFDVKSSSDILFSEISVIVKDLLENDHKGDILIFLSGEREIKNTIAQLNTLDRSKDLFIIPLFGRLSKDEQERVFIETPPGKTKVVVSTNISETSITIDGITAVIDSGLAKLNYYNPKNFTSSLREEPISRASCDQRKGRAGRTRPGVCYRLYSQDDYNSRPQYTLEEIYRTDLSEVLMRMSEIGIRNFENFDFISPPGRRGIRGAIDTLKLLHALNKDNSLSEVGQMMAEFPLLPIHSKILCEAVYKYPEVLNDALIVTSFLSTRNPFLLPTGEELEARKAHHGFRDPWGDFMSYITIYTQFHETNNKERYCKKNYLDVDILHEITNIKEQLEQIITDKDIPVVRGGGNREHLLKTISAGLIQFVCVHSRRGSYRSLTTKNIFIHPGSVMFRVNPDFIVAGEIVRTSKMFARSVSPLKKEWIREIAPELFNLGKAIPGKPDRNDRPAKKDKSNTVEVAGVQFNIHHKKGKKLIVDFDWERFSKILRKKQSLNTPDMSKIKGSIVYEGALYLPNTKFTDLVSIASRIQPETNLIKKGPGTRQFTLPIDAAELIDNLNLCMKLLRRKKKKKETLEFITLFTDDKKHYWFKTKTNFFTSLSQNVGSIEMLLDDIGNIEMEKHHHDKINYVYRKLDKLFSI